MRSEVFLRSEMAYILAQAEVGRKNISARDGDSLCNRSLRSRGLSLRCGLSYFRQVRPSDKRRETSLAVGAKMTNKSAYVQY